MEIQLPLNTLDVALLFVVLVKALILILSRQADEIVALLKIVTRRLARIDAERSSFLAGRRRVAYLADQASVTLGLLHRLLLGQVLADALEATPLFHKSREQPVIFMILLSQFLKLPHTRLTLLVELS